MTSIDPIILDSRTRHGQILAPYYANIWRKVYYIHFPSILKLWLECVQHKRILRWLYTRPERIVVVQQQQQGAGRKCIHKGALDIMCSNLLCIYSALMLLLLLLLPVLYSFLVRIDTHSCRISSLFPFDLLFIRVWIWDAAVCLCIDSLRREEGLEYTVQGPIFNEIHAVYTSRFFKTFV